MLRHAFILSSSALLASIVFASACSNVADDCENTSSCTTSGSGSAGTSAQSGSSAGVDPGEAGAATGGSSSGGSGHAGNANASAGAGATATAGGEGGGGTGAPCDGQCSGETPLCDAATDSCVQCLGQQDCTSGDLPQCDTSSHTCVECLAPADCSDPSAAKCDAGSCAPCQNNDDCSHLGGKGVCDVASGQCVECTGTDYDACGTDTGTPLVCDSLSRSCTAKKERSSGLCQPCVSDAQCKPGQLCVEESFKDEPQSVGFFCFWKKGDANGGAPALCSSARPYVSTLVDQTSIDGVTADVCGLRSSTCVARNQFSSKDCGTSNAADDNKCGFAPGLDSKCGEFDVGTYRCTTTCLSDDDCDPGVSCDLGASPKVCEL